MTRSLPLAWIPLVAAALAALAAPGCEDDAGDPVADFRAALPDDTTLDVSIPGEDGVTLLGAALAIEEAPLIGATSALREHTARARTFLSKSIGELLDSYRELVATRPTRRARDRMAWYQRAPNGDVEHLVIMVREGPGHFTMTTWLRSGHRTDATQAWRFLAYGDLTPARTLGEGRGALYVDLDNDLKPRTKGKVVVLYAEVDGRRDLDILSYEAATDDEPAVTRGYRFHEGPKGGSFAFDAGLVNVHVRPELNGPERVFVITRWDGDRRVRSDFSAKSDEVRGEGLKLLGGSECWRAGDGTVLFDVVVGVREVGPTITLRGPSGDVAACPAERAAIPVLPAPGTAPEAPTPPPETDPGEVWEG